MRQFFLFALTILSAACATTKPSIGTHTEDISRYRIVMEPPLPDKKTDQAPDKETITEVTRLQPPSNPERLLFDTLLHRKAQQLGLLRETNGYRILLYSDRNARDADEYLKKFKEFAQKNNIEETPDRRYEQPNYKVRLGNFFSRMEAYPLLVKVREEFRDAIITPTRIDLDALRKKYNAPVVENELPLITEEDDNR
ncbi:MAG: SPOR domain-containing protein [Bernardetiaceae bacterium]